MYNIHIHTVLHLNKSDDNTRGHIGTELNNKAETVMKIIKSEINPDVSEVRPMITREKEFSNFAFVSMKTVCRRIYRDSAAMKRNG
jgi:hypothetical protein